jgi:uncharacterized membrane protein
VVQEVVEATTTAAVLIVAAVTTVAAVLIADQVQAHDQAEAVLGVVLAAVAVAEPEAEEAQAADHQDDKFFIHCLSLFAK